MLAQSHLQTSQRKCLCARVGGGRSNYGLDIAECLSQRSKRFHGSVVVHDRVVC